jgi:DNA-binding PadR family transcriptional regulator
MPSQLNPTAFQILLALCESPLHGLGIADRVQTATDGSVELGPGTLYRSLKEMAGSGLIHEVDAPEAGADPRRRYYALTERGRRVAEQEAERLERIVGVARARNLLPRRA